MSESAIIQMVLDLEKLLNVESYVWVDPPEDKYDLKTPVSMNALCVNSGQIQTISKYKAETYLLLNRSGKEIIDQFLDAVVNNNIFPKYVIISKKRSVWEKSLAEHSELRKKYLCLFLSDDKSICILLKKRYRNICSKNKFFIKYNLKQYFFEKKVEIVTPKSIIGSIKKFLLRQHFSRELYSLWRENRNIKFFCKSLYRILAERCQNLNIGQGSADPISHLELCIYDTDKENFIRDNDKIKCITVSIVVCVYNALDDVKELLISLWNNRSFPYEIIIVDDGSEEPTQKYLEQYAADTECLLVRHDHSWGYTKSANDGMKRANSDYVVLLNSDTIVTDRWIEKMLEVFRHYPDTGIVGPLSNSATYQNVPVLHDFNTGNWMKNLLPDGFNAELMNNTIERNSNRVYPTVPSLNGFCTMISRQVFNAIGYLNEEQFPVGYGEEVDYCLRTRQAGFSLRVADDTYIFHEKSKSFGDSNKKSLSKQARPYLVQTYGEMYSSIERNFESNETLLKIRSDYFQNVKATSSAIKELRGKKIGFLLLTRGGNGGANSVCQEVIGMRKLGFDAYVINTNNYKAAFSNNYPELLNYTYYYKKNSIEELYEKTKDFDVIIATIFTTVAVIKELRKRNPAIKTAYYIQDYEPLFFEKNDPMYQEAYDSYTLMEDNCLFAKTNWLVNTVSSIHHVHVHKVRPSIDTRLYNPYRIKEKKCEGKYTITAMVRPRTPRRNAEGTLRVLKRLQEEVGDKLEIVIFGCSDDELVPLSELCEFIYVNKGVLKKGEVAALLAEADFFLDMSSYQAFGRTGLEGMCYGCIPVLPITGGTDEYAVHNKNAILVDTMDEEDVLIKIRDVLDNRCQIEIMQENALQTAREYDVLSASWSELKVLNTIFDE